MIKKVIKIKASGNIDWAVAIGSIGVAVILAISLSKNSQSGKVAFVAIGIGATMAADAVGILGLATTISAIKIAVASDEKDILKN